MSADSRADLPLVHYHAPFTRSGAVRVMIEELGVPCELQVLNLRKGEHKQPAYLAINPMGKVPAIVHGDVTVTEAAAIIAYLADAFPGSGLAPPIGDPDRGPYLKWLFFAAAVLEPAIVDVGLEREPGPASRMGYGTLEATLATIEKALEHGPYLLGERFSAPDLLLGLALRWAAMTRAISPTGHIADYIERLASRPSVQSVGRADAELAARLKAPEPRPVE